MSSQAIPWLTRKHRRVARLLVLVAAACYCLLPSSSLSALLPWSTESADAASPHPIDALLAAGQQRWQAKLKRQTKTLDGAVAEYRRRYGRPPPKGFADWYSFAVENDFVLIDEFDSIDEDLRLFRLLSSAELRKRTRQAMVQETAYGVVLKDGVSKVTNEVEPGQQKRGDKGRAQGFSLMLRPNAHLLPDMDFALTGLAEAMVYAPWEKVQPHNMTLEIDDVAPFVTVRNEFASWHKFTNSCHPASPVRQHPELYQFPDKTAIRPPRVGVDPAQYAASPLDLETALASPAMHFLERTEAHEDMCSVSPDRFYEYGAMYAGWPTFSEVYPVFGPGRAQGTLEIRVPSNYLYKTDSHKYTYGYDRETGVLDLENPKDPQWEDKEDMIYWRGSTTGGGSSPAGRYAYYGRHRLIQLAGQTSPLSVPIVHRTASSEFEASLVPVEELRPALNMAFTHALQCTAYPGGCAQMEADYVQADFVPLDDSYRAKMIFDTDGMGYSARFLALLASRSAPVKSTIYTEFYEDWLEPWVHYIPASTHYQELFNIFAYFLGDATPKGDAALRKIAEDSRAAKMTELRPVDLEVVYRLALEWARLWYKDEQDMDYSP